MTGFPASWTDNRSLDADALGVLAWLIARPNDRTADPHELAERFRLTPERLNQIAQQLHEAQAIDFLDEPSPEATR